MVKWLCRAFDSVWKICILLSPQLDGYCLRIWGAALAGVRVDVDAFEQHPAGVVLALVAFHVTEEVVPEEQTITKLK